MWASIVAAFLLLSACVLGVSLLIIVVALLNSQAVLKQPSFKELRANNNPTLYNFLLECQHRDSNYQHASSSFQLFYLGTSVFLVFGLRFVVLQLFNLINSYSQYKTLYSIIYRLDQVAVVYISPIINLYSQRDSQDLKEVVFAQDLASQCIQSIKKLIFNYLVQDIDVYVSTLEGLYSISCQYCLFYSFKDISQLLSLSLLKLDSNNSLLGCSSCVYYAGHLHCDCYLASSLYQGGSQAQGPSLACFPLNFVNSCLYLVQLCFSILFQACQVGGTRYNYSNVLECLLYSSKDFVL